MILRKDVVYEAVPGTEDLWDRSVEIIEMRIGKILKGRQRRGIVAVRLGAGRPLEIGIERAAPEVAPGQERISGT